MCVYTHAGGNSGGMGGGETSLKIPRQDFMIVRVGD